MLSKCLWKMHCHGDPASPTSKIGVSEVLDSLTDTINVLPKKRDNRSDPILEPHFKLVSVIHKLVKRGDMSVCIDFTFNLQFDMFLTLSSRKMRARGLSLPHGPRTYQLPEGLSHGKISFYKF